MNANWWKKLEDAVNTAAPKFKQAAQTVVTHVDRAADVAFATWEKEQISQKIGSAWTTAKAEWTDRKPTNTTPDRPKPKP